ncbi:mannonate dehydratase [Kiritimatiellota bacterium B12222]|nr:mannonate dehydratase [Kiritimatiellota bacterium B12222]
MIVGDISKMKLSEFLPSTPDLLWDLSLQLGVRHAICKCAPELTGLPAPWEKSTLRTIRDRFHAAGFKLYGLEGDQFDMTRIKLGLEGRDEDIEKYQQMLRNMGEMEIPLICYNFMAGIGWHRNQTDAPGRGGAKVTRFDLSQSPTGLTEYGEVSEAQMWDNYSYFIRKVMPVSEAAGVKMGMHPDDPPLPSLRGIGRILHAPENFEKALSLVESPSHGVTYCQANFSLMGTDHAEWIPKFSADNKIVFVHFRDVKGTPECFDETFHDEGPTDMVALLKLYHENGFDGPIRVDHVPTMAGESNDQPGYGTAGRLFAMGYLKGILETLGVPIE